MQSEGNLQVFKIMFNKQTKDNDQICNGTLIQTHWFSDSDSDLNNFVVFSMSLQCGLVFFKD